MINNLESGLANPRMRALGALRKRNVQLYMIGMLVSQTGSYMQVVAEGWLIYQLTNSALSLGLVGFIAAIPLAPWGLMVGTLADHMSRRKLLAIAVIGEAIPPFVLAALTWSGHAQVWQVVVCDIALGAMSMVDFVSRVPLIYSLVEREEVENGVAMSASLMNIARIVGPAVAGFLIAFVGVAGAFALNGLSFLFVLLMLLPMRVPSVPQNQRQASLARNMIEAPLYILRDRAILIFVAIMMVVSLFVLPYQTLLPVFARDILVVGPEGLGVLTAASGAGAVLVSIFLATQPAMSLRRRLGLAVGITVALAPATIAFAFARNLALAAFLLILVNGGFVALRIISFTYVHMQTADRMRGRMASILQMGIYATLRVGGLFGGFVASHVGAPLAVAFGGLICLVFGIVSLGLVFPQLKREAPIWNTPSE